MISAIIKGKIEVEEDKITSSVFDNLLHLPDEMLWDIIKTSCYDNSDLPAKAGDLLNYEFWPHWDKENTENKNFVEPDLFLHFKDIDIIIEAKREYNMQSKNQWEKELIAYHNEPEHNKNVILLAIDGIENENREEIIINKNVIIYVYKTRWAKIYSVIKKCINENNNENNIIRIFSILKEFMDYSGYIKTWFNELLDKKIIFTNITDSITILKNIIFPLQYKNNWFNDIIEKNIIINNKCINYMKRLGV